MVILKDFISSERKRVGALGKCRGQSKAEAPGPQPSQDGDLAPLRASGLVKIEN